MGGCHRFAHWPSSRQWGKFSASRKNLPHPAPHSKQHVFDLAVIRPRQGHILCDRNAAVGGFSSRNQQAPRAGELLAAVRAGATSSIRKAGMTYSGCWPNFIGEARAAFGPHRSCDNKDRQTLRSWTFLAPTIVPLVAQCSTTIPDDVKIIYTVRD